MKPTQRNGSREVLPSPYLKAASETFTMGDIVTLNSSGYVTKITKTTPTARILGQIDRTVLATDSDYASNSVVSILKIPCVCDSEEVEIDVTAGTAVASMVEKAFDFADHDALDVTSNIEGHFVISRVLSTTKVRGRLNIATKAGGLKSFTQTLTKASFTDGGSTSGTVNLACSIPVGAVFVRSLISDVVAFSGDTSAVVTIGDGTDVDRYNTGTPSVFATADAVDAGAASGTVFHSAAKTPVVTVTSASDFTALPASAAMTVTLFWYHDR